MSLTTSSIGASLPVSKLSISDPTQRSAIAPKNPSQAIMRKAVAVPLTTTDQSKTLEMMQAIDKAVSSTVIQPIAYEKKEAESNLAKVTSDESLTVLQRTEQADVLRKRINELSLKLQS